MISPVCIICQENSNLVENAKLKKNEKVFRERNTINLNSKESLVIFFKFYIFRFAFEYRQIQFNKFNKEFALLYYRFLRFLAPPKVVLYYFLHFYFPFTIIFEDFH